MGLVDYTSDSDSDSGPSPPPPAPAPAVSSSNPKPSSLIQRDSTGARKVIINLPEASSDDHPNDGPPSKRQKLGTGGGGMGLNAFLPAPKRSGVNKPTIPAARGRVLGGGAARKEDENLVLMPWEKGQGGESKEVKDEGGDGGSFQGESRAAAPLTGQDTKQAATSITTHFIPQSVARKPIMPTSAFKKKVAASGKPATSSGARSSAAPAKISLFGSISSTGITKPTLTNTKAPAEYKPLLVTAQAAPAPIPTTTDETITAAATTSSEVLEASEAEPSDLDSIAQRLNLPESALRQLHGRRSRSDKPVNILTFDVDQQYNINDQQNRMGLNAVQQANPVRSIAPGKHQLRSLLNAAQSQRDALEESFAQGKRNKQEAGRKYGW